MSTGSIGSPPGVSTVVDMVAALPEALKETLRWLCRSGAPGEAVVGAGGPAPAVLPDLVYSEDGMTKLFRVGWETECNKLSPKTLL